MLKRAVQVQLLYGQEALPCDRHPKHPSHTAPSCYVGRLYLVARIVKEACGWDGFSGPLQMMMLLWILSFA